MSISKILAKKGRAVVTAGMNDTVEEVAHVLAEKKIGAVLVLDDNQKVCGITSERDIVRQIAAAGAAALQKPVSHCMTSNVVFGAESDSANEAMEKMSQGRFRHLPVMKNDQLVGIVSIGDVVKRKIEEIERDAEQLKRYIAS